MGQIDLFNLVDADNISFYIVYLDEDKVLKQTEPLNATKTSLYTRISAWCEEHKNYQFLYYKSNKDIWEV